MPPLIKGLIFGLIFLFAVGPAFFALIQSSLQYGFRKALFLAIGISVSDIFYVVVVLLGLSQLLSSDKFKLWVGVFGAVMLLGYGIYNWIKKPVVYTEGVSHKDTNAFKQFVKGLLLNGLNPIIIVSWATLVSTVSINFEYDFNQRIQFFTGVLITILVTDVGKAFIANRLKHLITAKFVGRMNRAIAVILVFFVIQIVYYLIAN